MEAEDEEAEDTTLETLYSSQEERMQRE